MTITLLPSHPIRISSLSHCRITAAQVQFCSFCHGNRDDKILVFIFVTPSTSPPFLFYCSSRFNQDQCKKNTAANCNHSFGITFFFFPFSLHYFVFLPTREVSFSESSIQRTHPPSCIKINRI